MCTLGMAEVAANASYQHQREYPWGGSDPIEAALWPLPVDGLLVLARSEYSSPASRPAGGLGRR